jgi:hypothetical protein
MRVFSLPADDHWQLEMYWKAPQMFSMMMPRWLLEFELWLVLSSGDVFDMLEALSARRL